MVWFKILKLIKSGEKYQLHEEKKSRRLDTLQVMSTNDGTFLKSGLQHNIDDIICQPLLSPLSAEVSLLGERYRS